ncbi:hypothetical protein ACUSIJ_28235 [Pseudochelatococcus sp. B33]
MPPEIIGSKSTCIRRERWSPEEDELVGDIYPDYRRMMRALPHRSLAALKNRAGHLGVVRHRHVWTNGEVRRLRIAWESNVRDAELMLLFPGLRPSQIKSKARHIRARRREAHLMAFEDPALDSIRHCAATRGMSLVELDRLAGTGRFFQKSIRRPNLKYIMRAAAVLGGEVAVEWREVD